MLCGLFKVLKLLFAFLVQVLEINFEVLYNITLKTYFTYWYVVRLKNLFWHVAKVLKCIFGWNSRYLNIAARLMQQFMWATAEGVHDFYFTQTVKKEKIWVDLESLHAV